MDRFSRYLERLARSAAARSEIRRRDADSRLNLIVEKHSGDPEILKLLASLSRQEGQFEEALALLNQATERGERSFPVLLTRVELLLELKRNDDARKALTSLMEEPDLGPIELARLLRLFGPVSGAGDARRLLEAMSQSRAFRSLGHMDKLVVIRAFRETQEGLTVALEILRGMLSDRKVSVEDNAKIRSVYVACLIGLRRYTEALRAISPVPPEPESLSAEMAFHYGIASWGETTSPLVPFFRRCLMGDPEQDRESLTPSQHQQLAIAHLVTGAREAASLAIREALQAGPLRRGFNYWRYRISSIHEFLEDCREIRRAVESTGELTQPRLFTDSASSAD